MASNKRRVILLLPGGGVRGAFQVGFVRAMEASKAFEVEAVYGTSVGALIAPFVVSRNTEALVKLFEALRSVKDLLQPRHMKVGSLFHGGLALYKKLGILTPGIKALKKLGGLRTSVLSRCHCAAWNITRKHTEWFSGREYVKGMRASSAIPGVVDPVLHLGSLYCDGGIAELLPLSAAMDNLRDDVVYVLVNTLPFNDTPCLREPSNIMEMLFGVYWDSVLYWQHRQLQCLREKLGDRLVVVSPPRNPFTSCVDVNPDKIDAYMVYGLAAFVKFVEGIYSRA